MFDIGGKFWKKNCGKNKCIWAQPSIKEKEFYKNKGYLLAICNVKNREKLTLTLKLQHI